NDAPRCLPILLRLCRLRRAAAPERRRLLRVLLVRLGALPAEAGGFVYLCVRGVSDATGKRSLRRTGHLRRRQEARPSPPRIARRPSVVTSGSVIIGGAKKAPAGICLAPRELKLAARSDAGQHDLRIF